ncbi:MAG TPA: hypothetical protein VNX67_03455 [Solirubrobacteraceae bacterium]|jgi:hypothetical protein|nr:hypothetical protein [Solirubrobacteraceae bacterium]
MTDLNQKLLRDLANLASRYRPSDWERLAGWLENEERRKQVHTLLLELASVSQTRRKSPQRRAKRPGPTPRIREALTRVRLEDTARADLLEGIWLKLRERELLPTIAAMRAFAQAMGSKGIRSTRRDQAVTELMELLIALPADSLEKRMRKTVVEDRKLGEEYEEWVRLILGRAPGTRSA